MVGPLGMESGLIPNSRISVSSEFSRKHGKSNARLNFKGTKLRASTWNPNTNDENQWLQVDFVRPVQVTHVLTQGREDCCNQFVTSYSISYGEDDSNLQTYMQNGSEMVGFMLGGGGGGGILFAIPNLGHGRGDYFAARIAVQTNVVHTSSHVFQSETGYLFSLFCLEKGSKIASLLVWNRVRFSGTQRHTPILN